MCDIHFQVAVVLLSFAPIYISFFLRETVIQTQKEEVHSSLLSKFLTVPKARYNSMKNAATIVANRLSHRFTVPYMVYSLDFIHH